MEVHLHKPERLPAEALASELTAKKAEAYTLTTDPVDAVYLISFHSLPRLIDVLGHETLHLVLRYLGLYHESLALDSVSNITRWEICGAIGGL